jgi:hypothetical protein
MYSLIANFGKIKKKYFTDPDFSAAKREKSAQITRVKTVIDFMRKLLDVCSDVDSR